MNIEPLTLNGKYIRLAPMSTADLDGLTAVGTDPSLWEFTVDRVVDPNGMKRFVENALADQRSGSALPFVTRLKDSNKIVGSTRFGNIDVKNRKVEIGWTWVAESWQRTRVNSEAKLLMLAHAFEVWGCIRVEFKTDALNLKSRQAIERLGAVEEGTLRQHMITHSGRFRDSVYFSILDTEWGAVKAALTERLGRIE